MIFIRSVSDYHVHDDVNAPMQNPFEKKSLDGLLYKKNWIDTQQWHLEDIIRDPDIDPVYALSIKRRIDKLNQERTDIVEQIDDYFQELYSNVVPQENARHNTESLGWAIDRLSILSLKEYHNQVELNREDASDSHRNNCLSRKKILLAQKEDLMMAINWLMADISAGNKINKVYRQLKMYNDPAFNPVLYQKKQEAIE